MKKFISGIVIGALFVGGFIYIKPQIEVLSLASSNNTKYLQADYSINRILVNGQDTGFENSAFISEGTTYVPLRSIGELLNSTINWDQNTKTISITTNTPTDTVNNINNQVTTPSTNDVTTPSTNDVTTPSTNNQVVTPSTNTGEFIDYETAKQIAINKVGGGQVIKFEADLYEYIPHYNIEVMKDYIKYEVKVNAKTGDIMKVEID